ncbi:DNA glycosylase [Cutaneotrichosporon oleaginosum]|uniref:DNA-(apurinic or apyrimidinic site) lyase n=1 Tax=Cutaneotrichosporon oleaginosum TaxID=879819 RepID=A0A0J0XX61_9TREE|nr:DNA glycosylase [Cutaneotrichosporon oleaginosum]KLT45667.1 DNA glycosylase [Cutaneotrichosporon oleaginosum]TXT04541.1 hypothetical protein COLE_07360 [Cutaneotrichosporon oleaginosum]
MSPSNLTLANTLPVGQSFLWHRHQLPDQTEEYSRAVDNPPRVVCLRQSLNALYFTAVHPTVEASEADRAAGLTRSWLEDYFQLTRYPDLEALYADWRIRDPNFFGKVDLGERAVGVRVLRQDPWETLIAFITSTNNHIPRITSLMHRLCERFSPPLLALDSPAGEEKVVYRLFPQPSAFPEEGLELILRELGFGYRAGFLDATLAVLRAEGPVIETLEALRGGDLATTRERLVRLKGIGKKVADCIGLMCMDQPSLIPVDTHIYAIAARHPSFPSHLRKKTMSPVLYDDIQSFLAEQWGPLGGWCQAVVFAADLKPAAPKVSRSATPIKSSATPTPKKRRSPSEDKPSLLAASQLVKLETSIDVSESDKRTVAELEEKLEVVTQPERKRPRRKVAAVSYKVK